MAGSRSWAVSSKRVRSDFSQEPIGPKVVTQVPGPESLQLLKQLDKTQVKRSSAKTNWVDILLHRYSTCFKIESQYL